MNEMSSSPLPAEKLSDLRRPRVVRAGQVGPRLGEGHMANAPAGC